jgi:predicted aspartyl protease
MSVIFDPSGALVVVTASVSGPNGALTLRMALDTGSTTTFVNTVPLVFLGYDVANATEQAQIATAGGMETAPCLLIDNIDALETTRRNFRVVCHTLPASTRVDGLLGLDFLRGKTLRIDFRDGEITLD